MPLLKSVSLYILLPVLICLSIGAIAGWATAQDVATWYPTLKQPPFTPPAYLFGPVWTTLYILMGLAWGLIWKSRHALKLKANLLFITQLFFNGIWSFIFFTFHALAFALIDLGLIIIFLSFTIFNFYKIQPIAAYLLIPYWLWASFACFVNASIVYLNF